MTKEQIEKDVYETSHNLDFKYIPWSDSKVVRVVIQQHDAALEEAIDAAIKSCPNCEGDGKEQVGEEWQDCPYCTVCFAEAIRALKIEGKP